MKKFILLSIFAAFLVGCGDTYNHPIADHVYTNYADSNRQYASRAYAFSANGNCKELFFVNKTVEYDHFKWSVAGDKVTIRYDNSFYWKAEVRGTIEDELIYNSTENSLTSIETGDVYFGR